MDFLSILIKPASGNCNMRCKYCFYSDVTNLRHVKNYGIMSLNTLETLIKKALLETKKACVFGFQGGEPTLCGIDFFKKALEYEKKYNVNNIEIMNTLQTNGILIDDNFAKFFYENNFLIGLSIDASSNIHDSMRIDNKGEKTHERSMMACDILNKNKVQFNILTVITSYLAKRPKEVYEFYKKYNFRYIQFIPCLDGLKEEHGKNEYSLLDEDFGYFLSNIFDLWYKDFIRGDYYSIRTFDNYIRMLMGEAPENCAMVGHCRAYPVIEADGSVFPCDFYVLDEYKLGNINEDSYLNMLSSTKALNFNKPSLDIHYKCKKCKYYFICRGGCRRDREPILHKPTLNYYCKGYKRFFDYTISRMNDIALKLKGK